VVSQENGVSLERAIQLTALPLHVNFQRGATLAFREDWGMKLGPLALLQPPRGGQPADHEAPRWARQLRRRSVAAQEPHTCDVSRASPAS
jgi:hypothetical protein